MQQKVTELAINCDRLLGTLRLVEVPASWATFDDEPPSPNGASTIPEPRQVARPTPVPRVDATEVNAVLDDLPSVLPEAEDVPPTR